MGRPKVPLIEHDDAIKHALAIIDEDGVEALSMRRLACDLGVSGASLYHHFRDKEDILNGVRRFVLIEAAVQFTDSDTMTWQDYATQSVARYRTVLLRHPNISPLFLPGMTRQMAVAGRDHLVGKMTKAGVPLHLTLPIIDSVETFAYGSAQLNPGRLRPKDRYALSDDQALPHLRRALKAAPTSADTLFRLELDALLQGWARIIEQENQCRTNPESRT